MMEGGNGGKGRKRYLKYLTIIWTIGLFLALLSALGHFLLGVKGTVADNLKNPHVYRSENCPVGVTKHSDGRCYYSIIESHPEPDNRVLSYKNRTKIEWIMQTVFLVVLTYTWPFIALTILGFAVYSIRKANGDKRSSEPKAIGSRRFSGVFRGAMLVIDILLIILGIAMIASIIKSGLIDGLTNSAIERTENCPEGVSEANDGFCYYTKENVYDKGKLIRVEHIERSRIEWWFDEIFRRVFIVILLLAFIMKIISKIRGKE